ncbi:MAG: PPC domain-containing protein, partial [Anaerolinea sp.]|nr:PPC domain-containing protein [Anaerolinea sp.]
MSRSARIVQLTVVILAVWLVGVGAAAAQQQPQVTRITGSISDTLWSKEYALPLIEGQSVLITVEATSGDLDTYLELYSPSNRLVAANDDRNTRGGIYDSALGYTAPISGTYTVRVTRYEQERGTSTGDYLLTITVGDESVLEALELLFTRVELSGPVQTIDTPNFRIHYTTQGRDAVEPDYLNAVVATVEEVWNIQINQMGWPPPPSDNGAGGDNRYDIYIMDLIGSGEGALGITAPENFVGDHPATAQVETNASSSYIMIENDMDDVRRNNNATAISLMRATVGHEFHHAIQFGFDAAEPNGWFFEATSTWMETAAMGKDEDATGYVDVSYAYPEVCFGTSSDPEGGAIRYGDWTFIEMLSLDYGMNAVQELWRYIVDYDHLEALDAFARARGEAMADIVARWRMRNLARDYLLAPRFNATVWLENTITGPGRWTFTGQGIQELAANYFFFDAEPGVYYAGLVNDDGLLELYAAGVRGAVMDVFRLGRGGTFDTSNYDF